jgi:hypothetical protein
VQNVDGRIFLTPKKGLDKLFSAHKAGCGKIFKKGIDFIVKPRYNWYLREIDAEQEV